MGSVYFYHLTSSPLEAALPDLLARSLQAGWRVVVRGTDKDRLDWLDQKLWLGQDDEFLPHGRSGGPHDDMQPILLSDDTSTTNDPACLMSVDGADLTAAEISTLDRACVLFDGNSPDAVQIARGQWKNLTEAGCAAIYWAQEGGRWVKKAESGG